MVTYPVIRWLWKKWPMQFNDMFQDALGYDPAGFHAGVAVLIPKASKPRYDVVKSWRMITLLSSFAKLLDQIVLVRLWEVLELGDTQFGGGRRRGVHDAMANLLEFCADNAGKEKLIISMDVEGGLDMLD